MKFYHSLADFSCLQKLQSTGILTEELEDEFFHALGKEFDFSEDSEKLDDILHNGKLNINDFAYMSKDPGEGAWVKIRTERGFELRFVKRSAKKIDWWKELHGIGRALKRHSLDQLKEDGERLLYLKVLDLFQVSPVFVKYQRTKSQVEYLLPSQYEIVEDIDEYIDVFLGATTKNIKMHTIWNERNRDQVFYLQSRGISRERAQLMAAMTSCWFEVDIVGACEELNEQTRSSIVVTP